MYIRRVKIKNIRCIRELEWLPPTDAEGPGWHVVLGDNGSGKSTFLRTVALGLLGPQEARAARQDWSKWLRNGYDECHFAMDIVPDLRADPTSDSSSAKNQSLQVRLGLTALTGANGRTIVFYIPAGSNQNPPLWNSGTGWFSAGFGPFRRFTGGDTDAERTFTTNPKLARHLSVFGENIALTEGLVWLRELNYKRLERPDSHEAALLDQLKGFVNHQGFLPHGIRLSKISSDGVEFADANGLSVRAEELSDGFRSILSMTFELIRQLRLTYSDAPIFDAENLRVIQPGVVLIDEIDAHLHPSWQRTVGFWFTEHFPNFQFIVTTHSPLICQAAIKGSIFQLPTPGTDESGRMLQGIEYERLVYGDILDAYSVDAFGSGVTRSNEAKKKHERLATLNVKELKQELSDEEKDEQNRLRAVFPTSS